MAAFSISMWLFDGTFWGPVSYLLILIAFLADYTLRVYGLLYLLTRFSRLRTARGAGWQGVCRANAVVVVFFWQVDEIEKGGDRSKFQKTTKTTHLCVSSFRASSLRSQISSSHVYVSHKEIKDLYSNIEASWAGLERLPNSKREQNFAYRCVFINNLSWYSW